MIKFSLTQRLTLVFAIMLILCSALSVYIQYKNRTKFSEATIQNLSHDLAKSIINSDDLMYKGKTDRDALRKLFNQMMDYNPSVEVYLLDAQGVIIGDAAPPGHLRKKKIDLEPLLQLLKGAPLPIYGDDPRNDHHKKVFSVAPITDGGKTMGYLYVILEGEDYNLLQKHALNSCFLLSMLWAVSLIFLCGLLAGSLAFYWITYPIRKLTQLVSASDDHSQQMIEQLALMTKPSKKDEVSLLQGAFIDMACRIAVQWENLEMKDQLRREFVATISHDLRTPLMSIQGYLETLAVKADSLTESERRRYIQIALTQSEKVGGLAQQLFELARLEHGAVTPLYEKFILPDLVQDVLQKFELLLLQSDLDTDVNIQKSLPIINADMSMIERVLTNLVDNAIRHTPKGGRITLCIWSDEINVYFEIEDTGCGISSEIRKTLFETPSTIDFRRFDNGGLGLIIVRRMLQLHDGDITLIDSSGACFRFYIPIDIY